MSTTVQLPVVPAPDWETSEEREEFDEEESDLQGIAESLALHHSLRQSRNAWLTSIFPKFSSKVRGKHQPEISNPQPHTVRLVGKCDFEIGPHVFLDTSVFEVKYASEPAPVTTYQFVQNTSFPGLPTGSYDASAVSSTIAPSPLMSSLDSSIKITPHLIAQVNAAASSNPVLQNLLHAAAHNNASIDQLKTLAALIQSLATQPTAPYPNASFDPNAHTPASSLLGMNPPPPVSTSQVQAKKSDLLIEFRENQNERLLIPQNIIFGERLMDVSSGRYDMFLGFFVPWDDSHGENKNMPERPAILKLRKAPSALLDTIWSWLSEEARTLEAKQTFQQKVKEGPERVFLQHRLSDGDLISQLRGASKTYPMKSIKPSTSTFILTKPKRTPRKRKPPMTPTNLLPTPTLPVIPTPTTIELPASSSLKRPLELAPTPTQKKPKTPKIVKALPAFACSVCGMTNVPLMQGGRFCRTCLESGGRNATIAPAPLVQPPPHMASLTHIAPQPSSQIGRIDTFRRFIHHTVTNQPPHNNESVT